MNAPVITARCRTVASGGPAHLNYVRGLVPISIEERLGPPADAQVATPSETLLAALGSCLSARIHANALAASIAVHSLEVETEVDVVGSPMWERSGSEPRSIGFDEIRIRVRLSADATPDELRALVAHAVMWSPIANTLHDPVHLAVEVDPGPTAQ